MSVKQKLNVKNLNEKCKALQDLEKGLSNKEIAAKYVVSKNAVSTWIKNKTKLFTASKQCSLKAIINEQMTQFSNGFYPKEARIYQLMVSSLQYAKELGFNEFQDSDGWLRRWKET